VGNWAPDPWARPPWADEPWTVRLVLFISFVAELVNPLSKFHRCYPAWAAERDADRRARPGRYATDRIRISWHHARVRIEARVAAAVRRILPRPRRLERPVPVATRPAPVRWRNYVPNLCIDATTGVVCLNHSGSPHHFRAAGTVAAA
jgi:hypothetical protein